MWSSRDGQIRPLLYLAAPKIRPKTVPASTFHTAASRGAAGPGQKAERHPCPPPRGQQQNGRQTQTGGLVQAVRQAPPSGAVHQQPQSSQPEPLE